jgi:hypothetical protein
MLLSISSINLLDYQTNCIMNKKEKVYRITIRNMFLRTLPEEKWSKITI